MVKTTFWEDILVIATSLAQLPGHFRCLSVVLTPKKKIATHNEDPVESFTSKKLKKRFSWITLMIQGILFFGGGGGRNHYIIWLKLSIKNSVSLYRASFGTFAILWAKTTSSHPPSFLTVVLHRPFFGQRGHFRKYTAPLAVPITEKDCESQAAKAPEGLDQVLKKRSFLFGRWLGQWGGWVNN